MLAPLLTAALVAFVDDPTPPTSSQVREAVNRSLVYLQEESVAWIHNYKCASCHHAPMMIWAVNEAKARGYTIDQAALDEVTKWTLDDPLRSKVLFPPLKPDVKPGPGDLNSLPNAYGLLAAAAVPAESLGQPARDALARLKTSIREKQQTDGSWRHGGGRPPLFESQQVATLMTVVALSSPEPAGEPSDSEMRRKAAEWLSENAPGESLQAQVLRLWVAVRDEAEPASRAKSFEAILRQQRADGGWSQTPEMPSDAFATGQTLYVLSLAGLKPDSPEAARARAFLVSTQTDDGDWPMTSRPEKKGDAPAKDLRPITAAATAWATLGLLQSSRQ
jgi:hypothetical protein